MAILNAGIQFPVLIIGSGLGGLTLAHALQKRNIPYKIFERDSAQSQRAQGYRIGLDNIGADGLRDALTPELYDQFEKSCAEQHPVGGRLDGPSGKVLQSGILGLLGAGGWGMIWALGSRYLGKRWERWTWAAWAISLSSLWSTNAASGPKLAPVGERRLQADRRVLRSILLTGQSPHITYDSAFTSYDLTPDSVTAHFANGTSVNGSLLVGADGVRSKVASQLIGDLAAPHDLGFRIIYGKTPLNPEIAEALHPTMRKGVSFVTDTTPEGYKLLLVLETMRFTHDDPPDNYIFWTLSAQKEAFGEDDTTLIASQGEPAAIISIRLTAEWDPRIRIILDKQDVDQTAVLRMASSSLDGPPRWQTDRRVTVLGDAIHCMPPTGGQGANSAMYDGALLGMALGDASEDGADGWSSETVQGYEDAMRYNIGDIVGLASIGAAKLLGH